MLRALAWKEWREQRPVVLAGLAACGIVPPLVFAVALAVRRALSGEVGIWLSWVVIGTVVLPFVAAASGALAAAPEVQGRTLGFLLSRPVSRSRVWLIKSAVGLAAVGAVAALASLVFVVLLGADGYLVLAPAWTPVVTIAALLLIFASAALASTLTSRPLTAVVVGLLVAWCIVWIVEMLQLAMGAVPTTVGSFALDLTVAAAAAGVAGWWLFLGTRVAGARAWRRTVVAAALVAGLISAWLVPVSLARRVVPEDRAVLGRLAVAASAGRTAGAGGPGVIVVEARNPDILGAGVELWSLGPSGAVDRLAEASASHPAVSPDGALVVYQSVEWSAPGRLWSRLSSSPPRFTVRAMRADGTGDHVVLEAALVQDTPLFSPDGKRLAALLRGPAGSSVTRAASSEGGAWSLVVVDLEDGRAHRLSSTEIAKASGGAGGSVDSGWAALHGWSADGAIVLLGAGRRLVAVDPARGDVRALHDVAADGGRDRGAGYRVVGVTPHGVVLHTYQRADGAYRHRIDLLGLAGGGTEIVAMLPEACSRPGMLVTGDPEVLVRTTCPRRFGARRTELLARRLAADGTEQLVAAFQGVIRGDLHSRGSRIALVVDARTDAGPRTFVAGLDGSVLEVPPGWLPAGWLDDDRLLVVPVEEEPGWTTLWGTRVRMAGTWVRRLASYDVVTGELQVLYPAQEVEPAGPPIPRDAGRRE